MGEWKVKRAKDRIVRSIFFKGGEVKPLIKNTKTLRKEEFRDVGEPTGVVCLVRSSRDCTQEELWRERERRSSQAEYYWVVKKLGNQKFSKDYLGSEFFMKSRRGSCGWRRMLCIEVFERLSVLLSSGEGVTRKQRLKKQDKEHWLKD